MVSAERLGRHEGHRRQVQKGASTREASGSAYRERLKVAPPTVLLVSVSTHPFVPTFVALLLLFRLLACFCWHASVISTTLSEEGGDWNEPRRLRPQHSQVEPSHLSFEIHSSDHRRQALPLSHNQTLPSDGTIPRPVRTIASLHGYDRKPQTTDLRLEFVRGCRIPRACHFIRSNDY